MKRIKKQIYGSFHVQETWVLIQRILLVMVLLSTTRILFFLFNFEHFSDISFLRFMRVLLGGLQFDISAFLYLNSLYIILYVLPLPFRYHRVYQAVLKYLFFIVNGIILAANIMDFFYFDFILKRSTADVFHWAAEGNILQLFKQFFIDYFVGLLIWLGLIFLLVFSYNKTKTNRPESLKGWVYYPTGILILVLTMYLSVIGMRGSFVPSFRPISLGNAGKYTEKPLEMSIVLNTAFTIIKTIDKQALHEKEYYSSQQLEEIYTPIIYPDNSKQFQKLNVVILVLESFGKEYVGALNKNLEGGNYSGYTPFLDSLIGESKTFTRSFANGRKSIDALPAVVAGIPSMVQPYVISKYAANRITGLATLLKKKGYHTAFFHGAPNGSMGFDAFMKVAGYDKYYGMNEYGSSKDYDGIWGVWDEEFFQFFAKELDGLEEPFHATVFSISSHHPFIIPERYEGKFREGPLEIHIPVQYSDMALKRFFEKASRMSWYNNTLFVITADHANQSYFDVYRTIVGKYSIPIIFFRPSGDENLKGIDNTVVQQIDIMPTILGYLNYPEAYFAFGNDIFNNKTRHFAVSYSNNTYQLIVDDYILMFRDDTTVGLYNYFSDKLLVENIAGTNFEIQNDIEMIMKAFIQQYNHLMIEDKLYIE
ncbi:MAG: sulfatase-like hydrolase/transferase [Bacteroidota bacterium]|nr:sulfatase-like hydrolase/transferase [Bacteroidota bacterium]